MHSQFMLKLALGCAALVADIFSTAVQQGPALPQQQRQALTQQFTSDPAAFVARTQAALTAVSGPPLSLP